MVVYRLSEMEGRVNLQNNLFAKNLMQCVDFQYILFTSLLSFGEGSGQIQELFLLLLRRLGGRGQFTKKNSFVQNKRNV